MTEANTTQQKQACQFNMGVPSLLRPLPELSSNKTDGSCVSIYGSHDVTSLKLDF